MTRFFYSNINIMTEYQTQPIEPIEELDDLITKDKIENEALEEVNAYKDPLMCLITAKIMQNKAAKMAELIMTKAIKALKNTKEGKYEWMGVNVALVKPKIEGWHVRPLQECLAVFFEGTDEVDMTDELKERVEIATQEYNSEMEDLMNIENALFELENQRDRKIAEIQKEYETDIALAKRAVDEKKTHLIKKGKADVTMGAEGARVTFPK